MSRTYRMAANGSLSTNVWRYLGAPTVLCLVFWGCRGSSASLKGSSGQAIDGPGLTSEAEAFIEDSVPKVWRWSEFWTNGDPDRDKAYSESVGKTVPVQIYFGGSSLVVFVPSFHRAFVYERGSEWNFDHPSEVSWPGVEVLNDLSGVLKKAPTGMSKPLGGFEGEASYWRGDGQIRVLPLSLTPDGPISPEKRSLLERITSEAEKAGEKFFEKGKGVTITIPNFEPGEPEVWVLMKGQKDAAMIISFRLSIDPRETVAGFNNVVDYDTSVARYGIKLGFAEKIKTTAIKTVKYVVGD